MQIHFSFSISFPFKRKASVRAHNDLTPHLRYPFIALAQKQVRKQRRACRPSTIRNYLTALGWYNRQLKRLTAMAHIRRPLSSYVARHTWASLAYRSHVALPVISEALGHTNIRTTQIYIKSLGGSAIFQANKRIWDGVFRNTSCKEVCSCIYNNNDSH